MKKAVFVICLLATSLVARAQFEQGKCILNPSLTGLDFSYSEEERVTFALGFKAGAFVWDNVALMVEAGGDWSKPVDSYLLGVGTRYYFDTTGIYLGSGLDFTHSRWKASGKTTGWGLGIEAGYAYFLSRTVTIEPAIYYKWRFNKSDLSKFGVKLGFGLYF